MSTRKPSAPKIAKVAKITRIQYVAAVNASGAGEMLSVVLPEGFVDDEDGNNVRTALRAVGYSEPMVFFAGKDLPTVYRVTVRAEAERVG